ncbi:MAG: hypothetical protein FWE21_03230 [Defluviitaleaceae bacterium]|nr:hypothetical protein [Defluviitaleaceae bacterium]
MKRRILTTAAVALVALAATGCGTNLANNAHGLNRANDGIVRQEVTPTGRTVRNFRTHRGFNRNTTNTQLGRRLGNNLNNTRYNVRRGVDRTVRENHYLTQDGLHGINDGVTNRNTRPTTPGQPRMVDGRGHQGTNGLRHENVNLHNNNANLHNNTLRNDRIANEAGLQNGRVDEIANRGVVREGDVRDGVIRDGATHNRDGLFRDGVTHNSDGVSRDGVTRNRDGVSRDGAHRDGLTRNPAIRDGVNVRDGVARDGATLRTRTTPRTATTRNATTLRNANLNGRSLDGNMIAQ